MNLVAIDTFCALLALAGIAIVLTGARAPRGQARGPAGRPESASSVYATRILGVMMAAFGLALGAIVTSYTIAVG